MVHDFKRMRITFKIAASFGKFEKQKTIFARGPKSAMLKTRKWLRKNLQDGGAIAIITQRRLSKSWCVSEGFPDIPDHKPEKTKPEKKQKHKPIQGQLI